MAAVVLGATAMAAARAERTDPVPDVGTPPTVTKPNAKPERSAAGELTLEQITALRAKDSSSTNADAFAPKSFYVAPPKPKVVAAPPLPSPPPTPPPLPFRYLGMLKEKGAPPLVFLSRDDRLYSVRTGDVLDGAYRVSEIDSAAVTFIYLPMNETQRLSLVDPS
jgi:hypothetical protein